MGRNVESIALPSRPGIFGVVSIFYGYAKLGDARFTRGKKWLLRGLRMNEAGGCMPRYFFHLAFGSREVPDEEGIELPDRSAARAEAIAVIRDLSEERP